MTDVSSRGPEPGDDREVLTDRQGHPIYDNQNQRTVGARGPGTLENYHVLEKMSHFDRERIPERVVHAPGATAFGFFEADGTVGGEPIAIVHAREALPGAGQAHRGRAALLDGGRRARLVRGRARPARLRGEVLHRGRQLGPRRQRPRGLLHPRRGEVPGLHPLAEARSGEELDFDPLDDTKVWPEELFPLRHVGRMVLNRKPANFFVESEQIAFGTGVLVDGLDFSDDKMLVGRTFSYSDTQRYRVGTNYLTHCVPNEHVVLTEREAFAS